MAVPLLPGWFPATTELHVGCVLGEKYLLQQLVAEGGMGVVWKARHVHLGVDVAIKLACTSHQQSDPTASRRLLDEGRLLAGLDHPAVVGVHDVGTTESGEAYLVMDWLEGSDLSRFLSGRPISPVDACRILLPILEGLEAAHRRQVIHRDVKPENIFLADLQGATRPKLLDFGAALALDCLPSLRRTRAGTIIGSPWYMSPEQAQGVDVDHRTDIWAFCATLYECVDGRPPIIAEDYQAQLLAIRTAEPRPLRLNVEGARELVAIIARGLRKDPAERWPSATVLGRELAAWLLDRGVEEDISNQSLRAVWGGAPNQVSIDARPRVQYTRGVAAGRRATLTQSRRKDGNEPTSQRRQKHTRRLSLTVFGAALGITAGAVSPWGFKRWQSSEATSAEAVSMSRRPSPQSMLAPAEPPTAAPDRAPERPPEPRVIPLEPSPPEPLPLPRAVSSAESSPTQRQTAPAQPKAKQTGALPVQSYPAAPAGDRNTERPLVDELPATVNSVWGL